MTDSKRPGDGRLLFLDHLRGIATLVMIEVHVVNALLDNGLRATLAFRAADFVNGLVAPTFLFCAGFALSLTLASRWESGAFKGVLRGYLERCTMILGLGYLMHSRGLLGIFARSQATREKSWRWFLQADILQVIALSLALLVAGAVLLRRRALFTWSAAVLGLLCLLAAPLLHRVDTSSFPMWIAPYINDRVPSEFPLLPWIGFAFMGAALGAHPVRTARSFGERLFTMFLLLGAGSALLLASHIFPPHDPWKAGPAYSFLRLSLVCLLGAQLAKMEAWRRWRTVADPVLLPPSRHSLLVYIVHIPIVYGSYPPGLGRLIGPRLGWIACLLIWLVLAALMHLLARAADARARGR